MILDSLESDHHAIPLDLVVTSIKFKETQSLYSCNTDWRKILTNNEYRKIYNNAALQAATDDMDYKDFNEAIHQSGANTALSLEERCEGWYVQLE